MWDLESYPVITGDEPVFDADSIDADEALSSDPDFGAITEARFSAVVETEGAFFGLDADGWDAARLDKPFHHPFMCDDCVAGRKCTK